MATVNTLVWLGLGIVVLGGSFVFCVLLLDWRHKKQLLISTHFLLDHLRVVKNDIGRLREENLVMREYLRRRELLDDDDLKALHRELIELPLQVEAERNELLQGALDSEKEGRVIKEISNTIH